MTLKITTSQVVETSVAVNNNSPIQYDVHPDDHTQRTYEMSPGFKPFTKITYLINLQTIRYFVLVVVCMYLIRSVLLSVLD